jgi:pyruvate ferredoxin oxidoreductase delta subunit
MAELMNKNEMKIGAVAEGGTMGRLNTGSWRTFCPVTDLEKCIHCMTCWIVCPDSAVRVKEGKKLGTDMQICKGCGICATECPVSCIVMVREADIPAGGKKG